MNRSQLRRVVLRTRSRVPEQWKPPSLPLCLSLLDVLLMHLLIPEARGSGEQCPAYAYSSGPRLGTVDGCWTCRCETVRAVAPLFSPLLIPPRGPNLQPHVSSTHLGSLVPCTRGTRSWPPTSQPDGPAWPVGSRPVSCLTSRRCRLMVRLRGPISCPHTARV